MPYKLREDRNYCSRMFRRQHPEISKRWRTKHPEQSHLSVLNYDARHRYGLPSYAAAVTLRNRPCEICGIQAKKMCIDHAGPARKYTQSYRGVLCQQCNVRLGWFEHRKAEILWYLQEGMAYAC